MFLANQKERSFDGVSEKISWNVMINLGKCLNVLTTGYFSVSVLPSSARHIHSKKQDAAGEEICKC